MKEIKFDQLKIVMTRGIPASGKSTKSIEWVTQNSGKVKRLNKDLLRLMLDGNKYSKSNENFLLRLRDKATEMCLVKGVSVIIDDTNLDGRHWKSMCNIASRVEGVLVEEVYFECDYNTAIIRNANRRDSVPESVITLMYNNFIKGKTIEERSMFFPKKTFNQNDSSLPQAVIVDIDGTIAHNAKRSQYDYSRVSTDTPIQNVIDLVKLFIIQEYKIIFITGRDEVCREDTINWLIDHNLNRFYALHMRPNNDKTPDFEYKRKIYEDLYYNKVNVKYVLEDRPQVIRMWRSLGLTVLQLNDVEF